MTERDALLVLNAVPGVGNATIRKLTAGFGSASRVLQLSAPELLSSCRLPDPAARKICEFPKDKFLKNEYNLIQQADVRILTLADPEYPPLLRQVPDAPAVLYIKGKTDVLSEPALAMVGSRNASVYGQGVARQFASRLAEIGITVVSGLARGIDTAAHLGALAGRGRTAAVVGCGLTRIYPPENKNLFERIADSGAVVSEFPMEMPPLAMNFPRRNRIISGLSLGVVVVEAAKRSGALLTSSFALEQGREVFAIPGPVGHPNAQGVNDLIRQGARLVASVEDILEELQTQLRPFTLTARCAPAEPAEGAPEERPEAEEDDILRHLGEEPLHIDDLARVSRRPVSEVLGRMLALEIRKDIRQLPGRMFVRVVK